MAASARVDSRRPRGARRRPAARLSSRDAQPPGDDAFAEYRALVDAGAPPTQKRKWSAGLRALAGDAFAADPLRRSISWWADERLAGLVEKKTVSRWAAADGWIHRRAALLDAARDEVMRGLVSQVARNCIDDLEALDRLHGALTAQLKGHDNVVDVPVLTSRGELVIDESTGVPRTRRVEIAPAAYATRADAVRALIAIDRRRDEKRSLVFGALPDAGTPAPPMQPHVALNLSAGVARAMARAKLLAERLEAELAADAKGCLGGE